MLSLKRVENNRILPKISKIVWHTMCVEQKTVERTVRTEQNRL